MPDIQKKSREFMDKVGRKNRIQSTLVMYLSFVGLPVLGRDREPNKRGVHNSSLIMNITSIEFSFFLHGQVGELYAKENEEELKDKINFDAESTYRLITGINYMFIVSITSSPTSMG